MVGMRVLLKWVALLSVTGVLTPVLDATPAFGQQPPIELKPRFELAIGKSARKADTRRAALSGRIRQVQPGALEPARVTGGSLWLPRGLAFNFGKAPVCRRSFTHPPGELCAADDSIVGRPPSSGRAFDETDEVDGFTDADYVYVNGGAGQMWAFTVIYNPALVQEPVPIKVRKPRGTRWSHRLDFRIPQILQVVGGIPISLRSFDVEIDGIELAPGYLTIARHCPKRGHFAYRASLTFLHDDGTVSEAARRGALTCRARRG